MLAIEIVALAPARADSADDQLHAILLVTEELLTMPLAAIQASFSAER